MASTIHLIAYSDALVVLGTAGVIVPLLRRLGVNPVLGYLGAGALLGPLGLGAFMNDVPALYWLTIADAGNVQGIADLGVVFLLFLIGLELPFHRLKTMRRLIFGLGGIQVLVSSAVIGGVLVLLGQDATVSILLGATLSLSSTAIVLALLGSQNRLATSLGRASFSVLLAQDIAVIPILLFVSIAASGAQGSVLAALGEALLQALVAVIAIVLFGRFLMRPLFRMVAAAHATDMFIAAVLLV